MWRRKSSLLSTNETALELRISLFTRSKHLLEGDIEACFLKQRKAPLERLRREPWFKPCVVKLRSLGFVQHKPKSPKGLVGTFISFVVPVPCRPRLQCWLPLRYAMVFRAASSLAFNCRQSCIFVILEKASGS